MKRFLIVWAAAVILLSVVFLAARPLGKPKLYIADVESASFISDDTGYFEKRFHVIQSTNLFLVGGSSSAGRNDFLVIKYHSQDEKDMAAKVAEEYAKTGVIVMLYDFFPVFAGGTQIIGDVYQNDKSGVKITEIFPNISGASAAFDDVSAKLLAFKNNNNSSFHV